MFRVEEKFQRADKLFTTFLRFFSEIVSHLLVMDENPPTEDSPKTIPKRRGRYCAAFDCNNSYYGVDGHCTSYRFFNIFGLDFVLNTIQNLLGKTIYISKMPSQFHLKFILQQPLIKIYCLLLMMSICCICLEF